MNGPIIALIIVVVLAAVVVLVVLTMRQRRTRNLKQTFGTEYDRAIQAAGNPRDAEAELESRRSRREALNIRELSPESATKYEAQWKEIQVRFVDAPDTSLREADTLLGEVMRERGYPVEEFDQRAADISVDHPDLVQSYRAAHEVSTRTGRGTASTDDLRIALQRYRDMFIELLGPRERISSDAAQSERALGHQETAR
jgi:hypothetical protein